MVTTIQIEEKENHPQYAGFWIRFGAWAIDSIILGIPLLFFSNIIFALFISSMEIPDELLMDPASINALSDSEILSLLGSLMTAFLGTMAVCIFISLFYYSLLHSSKWQATIGKKLLGLKVEDLKGNKLSFWRSLGRYIVSSLLSGILLIGFILAAFTEKKQALHDLIVGSIVVKK
jgi:uncharacterized RDD family membrane protein YckC